MDAIEGGGGESDTRQVRCGSSPRGDGGPPDADSRIRAPPLTVAGAVR